MSDSTKTTAPADTVTPDESDTATVPPADAYRLALITGRYADAVAAYVAAAPADKTRMRAIHDAVLTDYMTSDGATIETARLIKAVAVDQSAAVAAASGTKAPADPRVDTAVTVAALIDRAVTTWDTMEGTDEDGLFVADLVLLATGVDITLLSSEGTVDVPADVRTRAAGIKVPSRRNAAPGRDVAAHIYQALVKLGRPATHAEIQKVSTDECPNGAASQGAIAVRLWPSDGKPMTVDGVVPCMVNGSKGARLA